MDQPNSNQAYVVILYFMLQVQEVSENESPWTVFVETVNPESGLKALPSFDKESKSL